MTNFAAVGLLLLAAACQPVKQSVSAAPPAAQTPTNAQFYPTRGVVRELKPDGRTAVIQHEAVPDFMPAMTMPLEVHDTNELRGLRVGDAIGFRMVVIPDRDAWIDQVRKLESPPPEIPAKPAYRVVRDVEPLSVGDPLPDYPFTNQLGQLIHTSQFKGQALAFTFFFTRCPYPTFCPLMSRNFSEAQQKLLTRPGGPTNWHLISISFDAENDSPAALQAYARRFDYQPEHWDFVIGDPLEVTAIADQFGENFWREAGSISHNLRTVVIDATGKVQKITPENKWTSDELVAEIIKAAAAK